MFDRIKILDLPTECDAYRALTYHVDPDTNAVTPRFNYWDIREQEDFLTENYNRRHKQGVLFLFLTDKEQEK